MKKYVTLLALLTMQQLVSAQTVNVHFKNGQVIEYPSDNIDYVDFSAKPQDLSVTSGEAVDLGLSVYWASCNLGADEPWDRGDFFAWGETNTKTYYGESTYSYYITSTKQYIDIGEDISGTAYDAATVNYGADWRMPTEKEMIELINNCSWEWTQLNRRNGYRVIGKNGNSIFLPAAGIKSSQWFYYSDEWLKYWCSKKGYILAGSSESFYLTGWSVYYGIPIRPVTANPQLTQ